MVTVAAISCTLLSVSCKKSTPANPVNTPPVSANVNTPNFVAVNVKWNNNLGGYANDGLIFYDLNHPNNSDKKYFTVRIANLGIVDSFKITKGPLPIDSAATNWPAQVTSCGYGYNTDMFVNSSMRLKVQSFAPDGRFVYLYDSIYHSRKGDGGLKNRFDDPRISGSNAGKTPQGETIIYSSYLPGGALYYSFTSYFRQGTFVAGPTGSAAVLTSGSLSSLFVGASAYDWPSVDNVISYKNEFGWYSHTFFDFKNWRYFTWKESCENQENCMSKKLVLGGYASLDRFCKWPAGWGKQ